MPVLADIWHNESCDFLFHTYANNVFHCRHHNYWLDVAPTPRKRKKKRKARKMLKAMQPKRRKKKTPFVQDCETTLAPHLELHEIALNHMLVPKNGCLLFHIEMVQRNLLHHPRNAPTNHLFYPPSPYPLV